MVNNSFFLFFIKMVNISLKRNLWKSLFSSTNKAMFVLMKQRLDLLYWLCSYLESQFAFLGCLKTEDKVNGIFMRPKVSFALTLNNIFLFFPNCRLLIFILKIPYFNIETMVDSMNYLKLNMLISWMISFRQFEKFQ